MTQIEFKFVLIFLFFSLNAASNSNIKLKVEVDGVSINQCNNVYRQQNVVLTNKQLCAGGVLGKGKQTICIILANFINLFSIQRLVPW